MSDEEVDTILGRIERRIAIRRAIIVLGISLAGLAAYFGTGFLGARPVPEIVRFAQFDFFFQEFGKYLRPDFIDFTRYTQENEIGGLRAIWVSLTRPGTLFATAQSLRSSLIVSAVVMTLSIGIVGTILGFPLALFFGVLGSERVTPFPFNFIFRGVMSTIRAIPALVWGLIYIPLGGIGPVTATLAIATDTIGNLGRLFTDELEEIEDGPIEAMETTGANKPQTITFGMLSQVTTPYIAWTLYIFEINVRIAVSLGIIGGGGLGNVLSVQQGLFAFTNMMATILVILVLIISVEIFSQRIRSALREGDEAQGLVALLLGFPQRMAEAALK